MRRHVGKFTRHGLGAIHSYCVGGGETSASIGPAPPRRDPGRLRPCPRSQVQNRRSPGPPVGPAVPPVVSSSSWSWSCSLLPAAHRCCTGPALARSSDTAGRTEETLLAPS